MEKETNLTTSQQNNSLQVLKESPLVSVIKIEQALSYPTLNNQMNKHGVTPVVLAFIAEVSRNLRGFNVKETMSAEQIEMFCEDFLTEYSHESLADIKIMFSRARLGKYGDPMSYIDSNTIMNWFTKYLDEKAQARERNHSEIKNSNTGEISAMKSLDLEARNEIKQLTNKTETK